MDAIDHTGLGEGSGAGREGSKLNASELRGQKQKLRRHRRVPLLRDRLRKHRRSEMDNTRNTENGFILNYKENWKRLCSSAMPNVPR